MMNETTPLMELRACACFNLRKAGRAVTQSYDRALQTVELRVTQFSILAVLRRLGASTISRLAEGLVMDRTTLTRDLKPLERRGYIKVEPGEDRRTRTVTLTKRGRQALARAIPIWEEVQARMVEGLGEKRFHSLLTNLSDVVDLTRKE